MKKVVNRGKINRKADTDKMITPVHFFVRKNQELGGKAILLTMKKLKINKKGI